MAETAPGAFGADAVRNLIAAALPFEALAVGTLDALAKAAVRVELSAGDVLYEARKVAEYLYIADTGKIRVEPLAGAGHRGAPVIIRPGEAFGWCPLGDRGLRLSRAVALTSATLWRLDGNLVLDLVKADPGAGAVSREDLRAVLQAIQSCPGVDAELGRATGQSVPVSGMPPVIEIGLFRVAQWLRSPAPYLMLLGYSLLLGFWYLSVQVLKLPRFAQMPGLTMVLHEWFSRNPTYGVSVYTPVYYQDILVSLRRIGISFALATGLGVPVGLLLGWSRVFKDYVFPLFEMLRPIPILAWVPLAIIMLPGSELPIIYLTFLASFFVTALNTMLGVRSIDASYILAAECLGASPRQIFRHVVVPGALPFIFTGLQISIGVAWFSLVAAEMISGQFGLGYLINTSYTTVKYPTLVIAMFTLGIVGYLSSSLVRLAGIWLMSWRTRHLALGGLR